MMAYLLKRLLLLFPTLLAIIFLNFVVVQIAPGGPIEQVLVKVRGGMDDSFADSSALDPSVSGYQGARGLPPDFVKELEKQYGFDKPFLERFWIMIKNYMTFDLGRSYFREANVSDIIFSKMPVSVSLGVWSTLLIYLIAIPLGISKATRDGTKFDIASSMFIMVGYAVPAFLFAMALIILFAGPSYFNWFPLRGLFSEGWSGFPFWKKCLDYLWHLALPLTAIVVGGVASVTLLTKNSFLEEIQKQYVITARAKGLNSRQILYGQIFRNAILPLLSRFPSAFIAIFFSSNLLIEIIFSLDGLGLLGFEAAISRDYPIMFGTLYIFTLLSLIMHLMGDFLYMLIDPRVNFEAKNA